MTTDYNSQNPQEEVKYQNQDASSPNKIDDINMLKKQAAEQMAKMQEEKKKMAAKVRKLMEDTKKKALPFKKEVSNKFKDHLVGILVMPPKQAQKTLESKAGDMSDKVNLFVIMEFNDTTDMVAKLKKKQDIEKKIRDIAKKKLKGIAIDVVLVSEIWDMCLKGKYEILNVLAMGLPVFDTGWIGAIRATEIHKMKVLQKFEKYVVSYVIAGSIVRGEAEPTSDIDTYIVIDDTDVTRMTSAELKQRLQGIIWGYAQEACMAAGVANKLSTQVYVLSDMWDSIKNANPVIFTFLRDGIPLYDRGMFAPWKMLLKKGKIKPTPEAISQYMKSGEQMLKRTRAKLKEIAIEDFFWATCTPSQGALMLMGIPPGAPKEVAAQLRKHFVKNKLMEDKYVQMWEKIFAVRKDVEHGKMKEVSAAIVNEHLGLCEKYLKRLQILFDEIEKKKICEETADLYDKTIDDSLAALAMVHINATKKDFIKKFKDHIVDQQLAPERYYKLIKKIADVAKTCETSRELIASMSFEQDKLARDVFNLIRADKGKKIEKFKVSASYNNGKNVAAIWLFTDQAYIILDVNKADTQILRYNIDNNGALSDEESAKLVDIENQLKTFAGTPTTMTKQTIECLKDILDDDVKIVIGA
jgi:predicted nucleotidyltransferase